MIRRPPRATRTDTLFPYTTLFRSLHGGLVASSRGSGRFQPVLQAMFGGGPDLHPHVPPQQPKREFAPIRRGGRNAIGGRPEAVIAHVRIGRGEQHRSEERRVGDECVSTGRSQRSPYHYKKNK